MNTRSCLRCRRGTLFATGAFWRCERCGLAITQQALKVERERKGPHAKELGKAEPVT
nr:hypothetical protein [Nitrospirota bacterium]